MHQKEGWLGIDVGGTGIKAGVFDCRGRMLGFSRYPFNVEILSDGRVELAPHLILDGLQKSVKDAVRQSGAKIRALSVSSQGETFIPIDKKGNPLYNAILWYDGRAKKEAEEIEKLATRKGIKLPYKILPIFTASKIIWLKKHFPEKMEKVYRYLLLPDYISWLLTGEAAYDSSTATSTGMYDEEQGRYMGDLLNLIGIEPAQLSEVVEASSPVAKVKADVAARLGLSSETLLVSGTNDQYAGALGAGNCEEGILSFTTGTCLAMVTLSKKVPARLQAGMFVGRFPLEDYYFFLAYAKTAGVVLDWFKNMSGNESFETLIQEAAKVPCGCKGLMAIPHFDGAVSPEPCSDMRGAFVGLTLQHSRADAFRALLEAFAFILKENVDALMKYLKPFKIIRAIGGGAKNELFLQIVADTLKHPVEQPQVKEAATLGAAMLAAAGRGDMPLKEACKNFYHCDRLFEPDLKKYRLYKKIFPEYRHLLKSLKEYFESRTA
jgi:xylulokinase